jgi:hypothetical protein
MCRHQLLRRIFETSNASLTSALGIRKGTLLSRYFQLYNAFFVSAVIHHIGALNCPYSPLVWCQFYFFMIQPVAITVEDFAIYLGRKAGLEDTCTLLPVEKVCVAQPPNVTQGKPEWWDMSGLDVS